MRRKIFVLCILVCFAVLAYFLYQKLTFKQSSTQTTNQQVQENNVSVPQFSLTEPNSLWIIVNKQNGLPEKYVPDDLIVPDVKLRLGKTEQQMQIRKIAHKDLKVMFAAAKKSNIDLVFGSGYRSGQLQRQFYQQYVVQDGKKNADRYSARPGFSEHQTGLSLDVVSPDGTCFLKQCWAETKEGKWVADHAHEYGFIVRFPKGQESITGYSYEPWHLRFVGRDLARNVFTSRQTLEEYFGLPAAPNYK